MLKQSVVVGLRYGLFPAQSMKSERVVEGNVITSARDPKLRIELPKSVRYVGADRWMLYNIADDELHAFVEANDQGNVHGCIGCNFEGYVPTKPELKHT